MQMVVPKKTGVGLSPKEWTLGDWFERKEKMQANMEEGRALKEGKRYTEEFKRSVVQHWLESGRSARKVAEEFGIKQWNLRAWRFRYGPPPPCPEAPQPETMEALRAENQRLRQDLARVTSQREILKKTLGIVSEG